MSADYSGPPIRFNRGFWDDKLNRLKLAQIFLGIAAAIFNSYCFPNSLWGFCTYRIHTFPQIFSILCVNIFFIVISSLLAFCNLLGIMDSYYKYNFPLLEKFLTTLATVMYSISSVLVFVALLTSPFIASWLLPLFFTLWTTAAYGWDSKQRWDADSRY
ncbi:unnamed protein product [Auanema sp. JU1783]|nr:unnamed protein product [Auanema sp. JU1783]